MAKSKRSRRARRQAATKQKQRVVSTVAVDEVESGVEETPAPEPVETAPRKVVDFAKEYYYVYTELRNILIITVVMFLIMAGLAYFI